MVKSPKYKIGQSVAVNANIDVENTSCMGTIKAIVYWHGKKCFSYLIDNIYNPIGDSISGCIKEDYIFETLEEAMSNINKCIKKQEAEIEAYKKEVESKCNRNFNKREKCIESESKPDNYKK